MRGNETTMWLTKGGDTFCFDIKIPTPKGVLYTIYSQCRKEVSGASVTPAVKLSLAKTHAQLGHLNVDDN